MHISVIVTETGDVLSKDDVANMKLPFTKGWELWGVFDSVNQCLDSFPSYAQAMFFLDGLNSSVPLAA